MNDLKRKKETNKAKVEPLKLGAVNENPPDISFLKLLKEDYCTHESSILEPGFWAVAVHRFGNWRMSIRSRLLRFPFTLMYRFAFIWVDWLWGISLCYTVKLGRRVRIWHHGGMVLGAKSIGNDVHLRHNTTFGLANRNDINDKPIIEDGADIGTGVCVLGRITVGKNSVIGANSVVVRDVAPYTTVFGVPARRISMETNDSKSESSKQGSVIFGGKE